MRATLRNAVLCSVVAAAAVSLTACGDDDGAPAAANTITKLIGPAGGTVELRGGGKVEIPEGALTETVPIKITKLELEDVAELPDNLLPAGKPYAFEPHGTTFARPVKVEIPFEPESGDNATDVRPIKASDERDDDWRTIVGSDKDSAQKTLGFDVSSFSVIIAARPNRNSGVITLPDGAIVEPDGGGTGGDAGQSGSGGMAGSGGTGGSGGVGGVASALYPTHGGNWNDYVVNDGELPIEASDTACDAANDGQDHSGCLHGGELRMIALSGVASCAGVTISDALDAFNWTCAENPVRAISTGLQSGKYLSSLIDFDALAWRPNSITATVDGQTVFTSSTSAWWQNPIVADNDGIAVDEATSGTIYVVTENVNADYFINSSRVGFVVAPGHTVTPVEATYAALYLGDPNVSGTLDFLWVEGAIVGNGSTGIASNNLRYSVLSNVRVAAPAPDGVSIYCDKSKVIDLHTDLLEGTGTSLRLSGNGCLVDGVDAQNVATSVRVNNNYLAQTTAANTIRNVTITGGGNAGTGQAALIVSNDAPGTTIENVSITNPYRLGILLDSARNMLSDISITDTAGNMQDGLVAQSGISQSIHRLTISGAINRGLVLGGRGHMVDDVHISRVFSHAIEASNVSESRLSNLTIANVGTGLRLMNSYRNKIWNVIIGSTGDAPYGGTGTGIETTFTGGTGSEGLRADNIFSGIYLVNNGVEGLSVGGSQSNVFQYMTIASTGHLTNFPSGGSPVSYGGSGVRIGSSYTKGNSFNNLWIGNNAASGLNFNPHITGTSIDWVTETQLNNLAVVHNGLRDSVGTGIRLGEFAVDVVFRGALILASNGQTPSRNCYVSSDSTVKTEGGLTDSSIDNSCTPIGSSTATLDISINGIGVVGPVTTDDARNDADNNGRVPFANLTAPGWTMFSNGARMWGRDGALPGESSWGMCRGGEDCRIYDWSLASNDSDYRAVLAIPNGNDTRMHRFWATTEEECAAVPAIWTGNGCYSTYLNNAMEIMGDGLGNENALCESGETCLHTPNIGAYQGHGALVSAGTFVDGTITGVTLMRYATNGR